ncbi:phytoene desaturase family protein [Planctomycetota bacterium]
MKYDCIIIGAGMSGLAAGIRLAMFDKSVCILEKHYTAGGLNSYYSRGGRLFDVGLHAVTNYVPKGTRGTPLAKLLRQLRLNHEELGLQEQLFSRISFDGAELKFTNDPEVLRQQVAEKFPGETGWYDDLVHFIRALDYRQVSISSDTQQARHFMRQYLSDPLLIEMLLCPLMFYGNAREHDMHLDQFIILFKSIYMEGFARPAEGVRRLIKLLKNKYLDLGGELRMQVAVDELRCDDGRVNEIVLAGGQTIQADWIISSAGLVETMRLCSDYEGSGELNVGRMSFIESISCLDIQPCDLGHNDTIIFFNRGNTFNYRKPSDPVDIYSGVICSPNNYRNHDLDEGIIRITNIADPSWWLGVADEEKYRQAKEEWYNASVAEAVQLVPDFREHVIYTDMFTPRTIKKYTGHLNGAVYGTPAKARDGRTPYRNLVLCGTDQGLLGIVGAMLSGVSIANMYCLKNKC